MEIKFKSLFKQNLSYEISDNYPDGLIVINYQKSVVYWNKKAQELFGFSKKEVIGKNIGFIFADEVEKVYQSLGENRSLVLSVRTKLDQEIFVEITCADANNKEEMLITVRDVTKTQKLLEGLKAELDKTAKASQNKSSFVASLSHELRTPVHSMIGFSQALLDGISGRLTEKQEKYVSIISKNATNLLALLNNVLDLSKIEAGKMEFNFKNFDVVQVINSVTEVISHFAADKKLEFTVDLSDVIKRSIYSDENMLRQVLLNVLNNAVKFTEIGSLSLKVIHPDLEFIRYQGINVPPDFTDKSYLMFSITDTGIGIAEEDVNNIFDEYRQFDRSASKKYGGTGLGLAITKKILNHLGGVIWVESEYSQGSTFSFIVPVERPKITEEI
ncbi:MAG: hypothetical protein A2287_05710 [Candidatus Melainabacteria bacterium RIFOXYA12_FULL_32_12]|nr:MAG: hypothetical protein A2255_07390 [Candidatus Melainabacteria bacterium RIFOXYA2_FULL_32_9]OGI30743.1 MAG: hypothetical protein A2287_05710 [Candidatus Melainabacteria bacterium RIFOXYA12_FULL_32_12]